MRIEEDQLTLSRLDKQLIWTKVEDHVDIVGYARKLIKKGTVKKLTIRDNRVVKTKDVELVLLSDMLIYAKPVRSRKPPFLRYEVREQFKRSFLELTPMEDIGEKKDGQFLMMASVYGESCVYKIYFRAASELERNRWIEAFNDRGIEEATYGVWDCPEVEAVADRDKTYDDTLCVRKGQRFKILERHEGWVRGYNAAYPPNSHLNPIGWIMAEDVMEVPNDHSDAQERRLREREREREERLLESVHHGETES